MRSIRLVLALTCTLSVLAQAGETPPVPSFAKELPKVKSGDPIFQFNQKDLTGMYVYTSKNKLEDPQKVFTVKDGLLVISGEDLGGITTKEEYSDYHLVTEWKWGGRTFAPREKASRDSGILLHCVGADGAAGGQWMESQECQIIEGGCGDFIMVGGKNKPSLTCEVRMDAGQPYYEKGGTSITRDSARYNWWGRDPLWKDVLGFRGERDVEAPTGEWNRMEVVCDGDTITNIVNGFVVNVGTKSSLTKGKILIQSEGAEILFRKIEVRPLIRK